jgi:putative transposase
MKERVKFVLEWEKRWEEGEGQLNFAALCRAFGISRQVGYVWLERYRQAGHAVEAMRERTRRPLTSPMKVSEEMEDFLVAARKMHPTWGPKKLRSWIAHSRPQVELPAQEAPSARCCAAEGSRCRADAACEPRRPRRTPSPM